MRMTAADSCHFLLRDYLAQWGFIKRCSLSFGEEWPVAMKRNSARGQTTDGLELNLF